MSHFVMIQKWMASKGLKSWSKTLHFVCTQQRVFKLCDILNCWWNMCDHHLSFFWKGNLMRKSNQDLPQDISTVLCCNTSLVCSCTPAMQSIKSSLDYHCHYRHCHNISHSVVFALHSEKFKMVIVEVFTFILEQEHLVLLLLKRLYKNILYFFCDSLGSKG